MMTRTLVRTRKLMLLPALAFLLGVGGVEPSEARADEAEITTAGSLDDHEAGPEDPDALVVGSDEMDTTQVGDPGALAVESGEADDVDSSLPAAHQGGSHAIDDLETAAPDQGFEAIDSGRLAGVDEADLDAHQLLAKRRLERAQANAEAARTRYGDMMEDDYPRGAARERIVQQRDETMAALKRARAQFDEAMGN